LKVSTPGKGVKATAISFDGKSPFEDGRTIVAKWGNKPDLLT
jgi:hypothetical protein